jgi:hypothetical protein
MLQSRINSRGVVERPIGVVVNGSRHDGLTIVCTTASQITSPSNVHPLYGPRPRTLSSSFASS